MIIVVLLIGLVLAMLARWVDRAYAPVRADDVAAMAIVSGVRPSPGGDRLFAAYLSRGRRYRTSWSVAAIIASVVLAFTLGANVVTFGPNAASPYADVSLMGIGGYLLGAMLAETHHLHRRSSGPRVASMAPRRLENYTPSWMRWLPRVALAAVGIIAVLGMTTRGSQLRDTRAELFVLGCVALIVWALVERAVSAVARRPRPAMPDSLVAADDAIRAASARSLLLGGAGVIGLFGATMGSVISTALEADSAYAIALGLAWTTLFVASLLLALRARRVVWPARRLRAEKVAA